jgi:hypothetical protein
MTAITINTVIMVPRVIASSIVGRFTVDVSKIVLNKKPAERQRVIMLKVDKEEEKRPSRCYQTSDSKPTNYSVK